MIKRDLVVVGASAGGVNALIQLIKNLPDTLAASLLVVLHRPVQNPSKLVEVLQNRTRLIVTTPVNGQVMRHRYIYVAPPDHHMITENGRIYLTNGPRVNYHRPAIDPLFRSAAIHYGPRVIGIILTGALDDGTVGLRLIKNYGGLAIVQDPQEAEHPDMPRHALENIQVDQCLKLAEMPPFIAQAITKSVKIKAKPVTPSLLLESESPALPTLLPKELAQLGKVSNFTCPECHGALWEIDNNQIPRYRYRISHAYSPDYLLTAHDETTENILWSAVRALEENAELAERILTRAGEHKPHTAQLFHHKAKSARQNAQKLKEILLKNKIEKYEKTEVC